MIHGDLGIAPEKAIFATAEDLRRNLRGAFRPRIIDRSELRLRMESVILRQNDWSDRLNRPMDHGPFGTLRDKLLLYSL